MEKVVKGAKYQKRPSASYFYNELNVPVGFEVHYRPRKGGKMIKHSLQLRKGGTPYWKAEEKLPIKRSSKKRNPRKTIKKRNPRKTIKKRNPRKTIKKRKNKVMTRKRRSSRLKGGLG